MHFCVGTKKNNLFSDQERGNEYGPLRPHHHNIQWAIAAPSSQHSMGHFSVVFVKTKIFDGPFNFCMGHLHRITKCMYQTAHGPCLCLVTVLVLFFVNFARKVSLEIFDKSRPKWMNYYFFCIQLIINNYQKIVEKDFIYYNIIAIKRGELTHFPGRTGNRGETTRIR